MGCVQGKNDDARDSAIKTTHFYSILLIQRSFRTCRARWEMRRRGIWNLFQQLEYKTEQDQLELYNFFNSLCTHIAEHQHNTKQVRNLKQSSPPKGLETSSFDVTIYEEPYVVNYNGPIINFPINNYKIQKLIDFYRFKRTGAILHPKYVCPILRVAAMRFRALKNINIPTPSLTSEITVCGDLHGSLEDLLLIFHRNGLPSAQNAYVFNGNFVDIGQYGIEVLLLVLLCFLAHPSEVFLNRGSHEDTQLIKSFGFKAEVMRKYGKNAAKILRLSNELFSSLPLCTVVFDHILVVHGGITHATDLRKISRIQRGLFESVICPPYKEDFSRDDWKQLFDLLWSYPQENEGCAPNTLLGAGTFFGPDVTKKFLKKHKLALLVRSHQCTMSGYEITQDSKLLTLCSASNYYALGSNKGSFVRINKKLQLHFVSFISSASYIFSMSIEDRICHLEKTGTDALIVRLHKSAQNLDTEFRKVDTTNTGLITINDWCAIMETTSNMSLLWHHYVHKLAATRHIEDNVIHVAYKETIALLNSEKVKTAYLQQTRLADTLFEDEHILEAMFYLLDSDNSGSITINELNIAWLLLETHIPRRRTRCRRPVILNKNGLVDLPDFIKTFRQCATSIESSAKTPPNTNSE